VIDPVNRSPGATLKPEEIVANLRQVDVLVSQGRSARVSSCDHALFTFTSRPGHCIGVRTIKNFEGHLGPQVKRRIAAHRPGQYTRKSAAIRYVSARLVKPPEHHRLLLVITDGKPDDIDHSEARYGIEDTRMAIREARMSGLRDLPQSVSTACGAPGDLSSDHALNPRERSTGVPHSGQSVLCRGGADCRETMDGPRRKLLRPVSLLFVGQPVAEVEIAVQKQLAERRHPIRGLCGGPLQQ